MLQVLKFIFEQVVNFLKTGLFDELDERYDERARSLFRYHGKHEEAGRHSKEYFRRKRRSEKE